MGDNALRMRYHPAKQEVKFTMVRGDKEYPLPSPSALDQYINANAGDFILQHQGDDFFRAMVKACGKLKKYLIQFVGLKTDYEDLLAMIDYYNQNKSNDLPTYFEITHFAELQGMEELFEHVHKFGMDSVNTLHSMKDKLKTVSSKVLDVEVLRDRYVDDVEKAARNIKDKADNLGNACVNLCFVGAYSSGKSTLINALLGYPVLPEALKSETAKMFVITSPEPGSLESVRYQRKNQNNSKDSVYEEWRWDAKQNNFVSLTNDPSEVSMLIEKVLEEVESDDKSIKLQKMLGTLNENQMIEGRVEIFFPIPLDSKKARFSIYDTPGTDSKDDRHDVVLDRALREQSNSILLCVIAPDKLEDSGNRILLKRVHDATKDNNATATINLARSIFVLNKCDAVQKNAQTEFEGLRTREIRAFKQGVDKEENIENLDDDIKSVNLSERKLFFVSAMTMYAINATKNEVATENDKDILDLSPARNERVGHYYQYNHVGTSGHAKEALYRVSKEALKKAKDDGDELQQIYICSGGFALEREIRTYGEKYGSAIRAHAILESVDNALSGLDKTAAAVESSAHEKKEEIELRIKKVSKEINDKISVLHEKHNPQSGDLSDEIMSELGIDTDSVDALHSKLAEKTETKLSKFFPWLFDKILGKKENIGLRKNKEIKKGFIEKLVNDLNSSFDKWGNDFDLLREEVLEHESQRFLDAVKEAIRSTGELSDAAKEYLCEIDLPPLPGFNLADVVPGLIDRHTVEKKFIKSYTVIEDPIGLNKDLKKQCLDVANEMRGIFIKSFAESLEKIMDRIKNDFNSNLDKYSLQLKALESDKETVNSLIENIREASMKVKERRDAFDEIVWRVENA